MKLSFHFQILPIFSNNLRSIIIRNEESKVKKKKTKKLINKMVNSDYNLKFLIGRRRRRKSKTTY